MDRYKNEPEVAQDVAQVYAQADDMLQGLTGLRVVGIVIADTDAGEGMVYSEASTTLFEHAPLMAADVMKDALSDAQCVYNDCVKRWHDSVRKVEADV